jgi:hypothetical protein
LKARSRSLALTAGAASTRSSSPVRKSANRSAWAPSKTRTAILVGSSPPGARLPAESAMPAGGRYRRGSSTRRVRRPRPCEEFGQARIRCFSPGRQPCVRMASTRRRSRCAAGPLVQVRPPIVGCGGSAWAESCSSPGPSAGCCPAPRHPRP